MEGKTRAGATSQIKITNADGTSTDITDPSKMNAALLTNNEKLYHQTDGGSEFLLPENVKLFGNYGEGPAIDSILNSIFVFPEGLRNSTVDFLKNCKRDVGVIHSNFPQTYTPNIVSRYQNFLMSWKTRKEKMSTYKENIGHYKAIMKDSFLSWLLFQRSEIPDRSG